MAEKRAAASESVSVSVFVSDEAVVAVDPPPKPGLMASSCGRVVVGGVGKFSWVDFGTWEVDGVGSETTAMAGGGVF